MTGVIPPRTAILQQVAQDPFDVLVVGGGIVGAGIARDAAMRGLRVALVEQNDFASGTSNQSSRLLHGGLRYLAQGRVGLVREASLEKRVVQRIAPHLAQPLPFLFPTYAQNPDWKLWQLKIGVKLYDALCGWHNYGSSQWLSAADAMRRTPGLNNQGLRGAVRYFDGLTNDARLVLDTLRSAAAHSAVIANRVRLLQARRDENLWQAELHDRTTDARFTARAKWIVNATGPWGDQMPQAKIKLRLTKGVHIVIERGRLPLNDAVVMTKRRRILFAIPWGERVIVGTTDTDHRGPVEAARCEDADIDYILKVAGDVFPEARLARDDVRSTWAGLRPLVADKNGAPSDASRSHHIEVTREGWLDVGGGKLTTYRLMAEEAVDTLLRADRRRAGPCRTAEEPLLPDAADAAASAIVPPPVSKQLVDHYCTREWATCLEDVMIRRTSWHHYLADPSRAAAQVAQWMGEHLRWSAAEVGEAVRRYTVAVGSAVSDRPREEAAPCP